MVEDGSRKKTNTKDDTGSSKKKKGKDGTGSSEKKKSKAMEEMGSSKQTKTTTSTRAPKSVEELEELEVVAEAESITEVAIETAQAPVINVSLRATLHLDRNGQYLKHGQSPDITPREPALVAAMAYKSFAPCRCICLEWCNNEDVRSRTYARVYENHMEINRPCNPLCCCGDSSCTVDRINKVYFDDLNGHCPCWPFCHFPCVCCGPPVVYEYVPKCCYCIDCVPCFGRTMFHSPCNAHGLRSWICCGLPCFMCCAKPIVDGTKGGTDWLSKYRAAFHRYAIKHDVPRYRRARFHRVVDIGCWDCGTARQVDEYAGPIPTNDPMERV